MANRFRKQKLTEPSDDYNKYTDGESAQQEEKTTEITEKTETTDITTETTRRKWWWGFSRKYRKKPSRKQPEIVSITYRYKVTVECKK